MNTAKVPTLPDVLLSDTGPATKQDRRYRHPTARRWPTSPVRPGCLAAVPADPGPGEDHLVPNRAESRVPARYRSALLLALTAIAFELLALAGIRQQFFGTGFLSSFVSVTPGGAIIAAVSAALGAVS
jgi:hypothetical protein